MSFSTDLTADIAHASDTGGARTQLHIDILACWTALKLEIVTGVGKSVTGAEWVAIEDALREVARLTASAITDDT